VAAPSTISIMCGPPGCARHDSTTTGVKAGPLLPASRSAHCRACRRQPNNCCGSQPVPTRNRRHRLAAFTAFGDDPRLLLRRPGPAPACSGEDLDPAHGMRLRFGQKLSVRHVSNPLDPAGGTFADQLSVLKVGPKGRLLSIGANLIKALPMRAAAARVAPDLLYDPGFCVRRQEPLVAGRPKFRAQRL